MEMSLLDQIIEAINKDHENDQYPLSIVINHSGVVELQEDKALSSEVSHCGEYNDKPIYKSSIRINSFDYVVTGLPDFHPHIQRIFQILGREPIFEDDSEEEMNEKKYTVFSTVDAEGNLIV